MTSRQLSSHKTLENNTKLDEVKSILIGNDIHKMQAEISKLKDCISPRDEKVERILRDFRTRLTLLESKTNEIKKILKTL